MKKVLFATTALVMTAGVAAAEVSLSGDGRMGVVYDGNDFDFTSRARVTFTLSGETDGGLAFGGSFRVDHANSNNGANGNVYISGAFGKITMGDIDSAAESAIGDLSGVGLTGLGDYNEFFYLTSGLEYAGNPGLLYTYAGDNFNIYLSAYDGNNMTFTNVIDGLGGNSNDPDWKLGSNTKGYSIGGNYTFGNFTVAAGVEMLDADAWYDTNSNNVLDAGEAVGDLTMYGIAGIGTFGDVKVTAAYAVVEEDGVSGSFDQYGLSAEATFGATTVSAFWREVDVYGISASSYGIGASYDLGGGASVVGGIVDSDFEADVMADLGISFKF